MARQSGTNDRDRDYGQMIVRRRRAAGLSQQQLGALVGVSFQQIGKYERGEDSLRVTLYEDIMHALNGWTPGFAEDQASYRAPPRTDLLKDELLKSAERLESEARRLQELSEKL